MRQKLKKKKIVKAKKKINKIGCSIQRETVNYKKTEEGNRFVNMSFG